MQIDAWQTAQPTFNSSTGIYSYSLGITARILTSYNDHYLGGEAYYPNCNTYFFPKGYINQ